MMSSDAGSQFNACFSFGDLKVEILQGTILKPGREIQALVSSDDNYFTMGSGISARLRKNANSIDYVREAQKNVPVVAGSAVVTGSYGLKDLIHIDYVIHGAVIDYDTYALPLPDLVERTTENCLKQAEALRIESILFPAFATGAGKLSMEECARRMCTAIKNFVAQERQVKNIYILLYLPEQEEGASSDAVTRLSMLNNQFIREANLVLGVPYDPGQPIHQVRDFYGDNRALQQLEDIITGKKDDEKGKHHCVILGGPLVGKGMLLDYLYYLSQQPGSTVGEGRRLVKIIFGRVHENTPASFIYRKFLSALEEAERERDSGQLDLLKEIKETYSDPELDCETFLAFLDRHQDSYSDLVFLINKLPRLLRMEAQGPEKPKGFQVFWNDLDRLQKYVRIFYTARPEDFQTLHDQRLEPFADSFKSNIEKIYLGCVKKEDRENWLNDLFGRYLGRKEGAPRFIHERFDKEAGRHPYLIILLGYALIMALKKDMLTNPGQPARYTKNIMAKFLEAACAAIDEPRRSFFDKLLSLCSPEHRKTLELLAKAIVIEEEQVNLIPELKKNDPKAVIRLKELQAKGDLRTGLNQESLIWLEVQGFLVDTKTRAQFMAKSFASWIEGYFGLNRERNGDQSPVDIEISLISNLDSSATQGIRTMFRGQGARIETALRKLHPEDKRFVMEELGKCISHLMHPIQFPEKGSLKSPEELGNYVMTNFATSEIKFFMQNPPFESTILYNVDDSLKDIPWELILETCYAGEIPFRTGRRIIGPPPRNVKPVVRGTDKIKALLIGDPDGSLQDARKEVEDLAEKLRNDDHFEDPDVLIGPQQCRRGPISIMLESGKYGLIHYSGHSKKEGDNSAWILANGQTFSTDSLTNALQMGPPAFIFSSSCESAAAESPQPTIYENQTFDLPSAILLAGVEAYVGTLWEVDSYQARRFVDIFYDHFLSGKENLGECLRCAKWFLKQTEENEDQINWLSFILYGDPHLMPSNLFPAFK